MAVFIVLHVIWCLMRKLINKFWHVLNAINFIVMNVLMKISEFDCKE